MKKNITSYENITRVGIGLGLFSLAAWGLYSAFKIKNLNGQEKPDDVEKQAKEYFPVESDSELAAGHPIVGIS